MAETITIARPYARAVFELAHAAEQFSPWSDALASLADVVRVPAVAALVDAPEVGASERARVIIEICGDALATQGQNLVRLLSEEQRLHCLPEIAAEYNRLRAEAESVVDVELTTPVELDAQHREEVQVALKRRLGRQVRLHCSLDETLVGGAVIRAGDLVIDGSIRGRLDRLVATLGQ